MTTNILYTVCCVSMTFMLVSCIFPKYQETEWHIRPDGSVLLKHYSYDMYSPAATTNKAREDFIKLVEDMEPPVLKPTPDPDTTGVMINLRELQEKYGGLNMLQEAVLTAENAAEMLTEITSNGYYWMTFGTNEAAVETNGEIVRLPEVTKELVVRWPTNTVYLWYKETSLKQHGISMVGFWREYIARGRDLAAFGTNNITHPAAVTATEK